jgi:glycosidase
MLNSLKDSAGGYHGYWAQDLYAINSNYGTAADLKSLVSTAHAKVCTFVPLLRLPAHVF